MKTILLVDDEPPLRLLVQSTLTGPGLRILEATDGLEAAKLALDERPDLIVLDSMLPGMNGIDFARLLRHNPVTADTPIIMLTARGQEVDGQQARQVGVESLVKPFGPLELIRQVQAVLGA